MAAVSSHTNGLPFTGRDRMGNSSRGARYGGPPTAAVPLSSRVLLVSLACILKPLWRARQRSSRHFATYQLRIAYTDSNEMTAPILIFGGSGGVGAALASRLLVRGLPIHIAARDSERLAQCSAKLGGCRYTICDAADEASLANAVAEASASGGGLSGLAWCVGSIVLKPLKRATADDFLAAFRLNVVGAALAIQAAEQALRLARGSVVLFSSVAAGSGFPNHAVIAAAKGAVEALTRSLAADLAPEVRVNCIAPSLVRTPLAAALTSSEQMAKSIAALHPLPRLGEADDIAAAAAFFLTGDSDWITGQVLSVDGGRGTVRTKG